MADGGDSVTRRSVSPTFEKRLRDELHRALMERTTSRFLGPVTRKKFLSGRTVTSRLFPRRYRQMETTMSTTDTATEHVHNSFTCDPALDDDGAITNPYFTGCPVEQPLAIGDLVRGVGMGTGEVLTLWTTWDGKPKATVRFESGATWDYAVESLTKWDGPKTGSGKGATDA